MQISARVDYGVRALLELTPHPGAEAADQTQAPHAIAPLSAHDLAKIQGIPVKFLEAILTTLRKAGLLVSVRGSGGGFSLAKPADEITVADIIRALDGPLASVRGMAPEDAEYQGKATHLRDVWVALRVSLRDVLEDVTLSDIVENRIPAHVLTLLTRGGAWERR